MSSQDLWDVKSALQIITNPTVDSKLWAEAIEWLLLNGPSEIKKVLLDASKSATLTTFPELSPHLGPGGEPFYDVGKLAKSLNIDEKEAKRLIEEKEKLYHLFHISDPDDNSSVH